MALSDPFGFSGALIDAQLRVGVPVGEGGFSVVYRAHHMGLDEPVALKCLKLPPGLAPEVTDNLIKRFQSESRISYRLSQGNLDIVRSISSGTAHAPLTGQLVPYIALEWLDGPSLAKDLARRREAQLKGRSLHEVMELLDPAARALDYAHKQGVVHRDVKPGNLVLATARDGIKRVKVLDFGLAKIIDPDGIGIGATQTVAAMVVCSPSYGAPEQFYKALGPIGSYTDVYSLALIILEMLCDRKIRPSSISASARAAIAPVPVSPLALGIQVTAGVDALFRRTLQLDWNARPKDMAEFWDELVQLGQAYGSPMLAGASSSPPPAALHTAAALHPTPLAAPPAPPPAAPAVPPTVAPSDLPRNGLPDDTNPTLADPFAETSPRDQRRGKFGKFAGGTVPLVPRATALAPPPTPGPPQAAPVAPAVVKAAPPRGLDLEETRAGEPPRFTPPPPRMPSARPPPPPPPPPVSEWPAGLPKPGAAASNRLVVVVAMALFALGLIAILIGHFLRRS